MEEEKLQEVAKALGISVDAIKNFSEGAAINFFNNFYDNSFTNSQGTFNASQCSFNPMDKIVELFEENKQLYERLLQSEKDKITYLEKLHK